MTDLAGRWMNGRTVERPGAHRRALHGAEECSTRAHLEVWQNHPHDASDRTGRRAGRPGLRDRRQGEVGEDIQVALRCPAVMGPSGGLVSDAGWCRRPLRCRRRNTAVDEQSAKVVVIPPSFGVPGRGAARPVTPGRVSTLSDLPCQAGRPADRESAWDDGGCRQADRQRCARPIGGPSATAQRHAASSLRGGHRGPVDGAAAHDDDTTSASARRRRPFGRCVVPRLDALAAADWGSPDTSGSSRLHRRGPGPTDVRGTLRWPQGLRRRLPAPHGRTNRSTRHGPITRPAAASPPRAAYRRWFVVPRLATGWLAGRMEGQKGRRTWRLQEREAQESNGPDTLATAMAGNGRSHGARP